MSSYSRARVLVTRAIFPEHLERLAGVFDLEANQDDRSFSPEELALRLADKDGALVTGSDRIDDALLARAPRLRVVSSISVGYNHIDLAACSRARVMATNTPDVLTETTADLGWTLMMAAARQIFPAERWLRAGQWHGWSLDQWLGSDIHHRTLGIVGMGRIGQAIARRARGFSMPVLYHNRSPLDDAIERELGARYLGLDELLEQSDHVMLVVPYSPQTHHLIGAPQLARMKPGATLTNIARGGIIDEAALCAALREGRLGAAGLDVFEGEPAVRAELLELQNVALTPHIGSASRATRAAMATLAIDNLCSALTDVRPQNLLNPDAWAGAR